MYLTPKRLRNMGLGVKLSDRTDAEVAEQIRNSTAAVDAYCNVPTMPQPHSFKGGTIVDEVHSWGQINRNHRIYPFHTPVKTLSSLRLLATESLYIDFPSASDYYINPLDGYVEIINFALTKIGLWGQANVPQMGLIDPVALFSYTYGRSIPVLDEDIYAIPNASGEEDYTDYMAPDGFWDESLPVVVKVDSIEMDESDYTLDHSGGFVKLATGLESSDSVKVSYTARIPREVARATALGTVAFIGEAGLAAVNMTGIESIKAEELEIRRTGARRAETKQTSFLPLAAQNLLDGFVFWTVRSG